MPHVNKYSESLFLWQAPMLGLVLLLSPPVPIDAQTSAGTPLQTAKSPHASVLVVADEFPAMQVLVQRLEREDGVAGEIIDQQHLPESLALYQAVVVYIHKELAPAAERSFIDYACSGGRLVLLHHSISSGKRQNRDWFSFLGVELPEGPVDRGGYKWIEGVTADWVNLADGEFIMTNRVEYPSQVLYSRSEGHPTQRLPGFTLRETEVYLNHVLKGEHRLLLGLKYTDKQTSKTWMQQTAGWYRSAGKGWIVYFMPGHSVHDFENPTYGRVVLNAVKAPLSRDNSEKSR